MATENKCKKKRRVRTPLLNEARTKRNKARRAKTHANRMAKKRVKLTAWAIRNGVSPHYAATLTSAEVRRAARQ